MSVNEKMTALADEVRRLSGSEDKLGIEAMTEKLAAEEGSQSAYDKMWDAMQLKGGRRNYRTMFTGKYWTKDLFKPRYDMKPTDMYYMFSEFDYNNSGSYALLDMVERLEDLGVTLDTSESTNFQCAFYFAGISRLGVIDMRSATNAISAFYNIQAHTIEKLIVPDNVSMTGGLNFSWSQNLENIEFEGICGSSVLLGWAPLTKPSILSVMNSLSDTATGKTAEFATSAVDSAFETAEGLKDGSASEEWLALVAAKPNWTIALSIH